jgi:hypothetical protein
MLDQLTKIMLVEDEKMVAVMRHLHVRTPWSEIKGCYENWDDVFKQDHYKFISYGDMLNLSQVFYFKGKDMARSRNEFIHFLRNHQEFYNDDLQIVYQRMCEAREQYNTVRAEAGNLPIPFINWIPEYGGTILDQKSRMGAEAKWHHDNAVPYCLDGVVPGRKSKKGRSADVSDEEEDV